MSSNNNALGMFVKDTSEFTLYDTDVYFWCKKDISYMGHGWTNPTLSQTGSDDNLFRITRQQPQNAQDVNSDVLVAIQRVGKGRYLSCRRKAIITGHNSALAEWRSKIGEFETFKMIMLPHDNSVIFKSHNDLYLAVNDTFHTCEFKTCKGRDENGFPLKGRWEILDRSRPGVDQRGGNIDTANAIKDQGIGVVGKIGNLANFIGGL